MGKSVNYRIVIHTELSGKQWFYIQKQWLGMLWFYCRHILDMSMYSYKIVFDSLEAAKEFIKLQEQKCLNQKNAKIVKKEILKYTI